MIKVLDKMEMYKSIIGLLHRIGLDIRRFPGRDQRMLLQYLRKHDVNDCFDVGANTGQFAQLLRSIGFNGNIFSFEPQTNAFQQLGKNASANERWKIYNLALGNVDGKSIMNISQNSFSSSILDINELLTDVAPETGYVATQEIQVSRLDTFIKSHAFDRRFFLKIDAQGFEANILEGARDCFNNIYALQIELACVSLYKGEKLFEEMKSFIEAKGFYLSGIESGFADAKTGRLLQAEAIFLREV